MGGPKGGGPEGWRAQNFAFFFFSLPPQFSFFLPSLGGLLVEFLWCLKRWGPQMSTFGLSGCRVKPRRLWRLQTSTFQGPGASKTTKIQREDPQEREERKTNVAGEAGKKRAKFWAVCQRAVRERAIRGKGDGPAEGRSAQPKHHTPPTHKHTATHTHTPTHTQSRFCPEFRLLFCPDVVFFVQSSVFFLILSRMSVFLSRLRFFLSRRLFGYFVPWRFFCPAAATNDTGHSASPDDAPPKITLGTSWLAVTGPTRTLNARKTTSVLFTRCPQSLQSSLETSGQPDRHQQNWERQVTSHVSRTLPSRSREVVFFFFFQRDCALVAGIRPAVKERSAQRKGGGFLHHSPQHTLSPRSPDGRGLPAHTTGLWPNARRHLSSRSSHQWPRACHLANRGRTQIKASSRGLPHPTNTPLAPRPLDRHSAASNNMHGQGLPDTCATWPNKEDVRIKATSRASLATPDQTLLSVATV